MLLNELKEAPADHEVNKRITAMVKRILAKCKQHGCNIYLMPGVALGVSPEKTKFVDIHAESIKSKIYSKHFLVNDYQEERESS